MCATGGGIKLLVMLCHVLFINHNVKHKVKFKQTQTICWESKHGLSDAWELHVCVYECADSVHVFQMSVLS